MPRDDHFVAKTYLKHFTDASIDNRLHAIRKSDLRYFRPRPKDVCHEVDGDLTPYLLNAPSAFGDFRKIFEREWNPSIQTLLDEPNDIDARFAISGYMAQLHLCTPAMIRVLGDLWIRGRIHRTKFDAKRKRLTGKADSELEEGLAAWERGEFALEVDPEYIRGTVVSKLLPMAVAIYRSDWTVWRTNAGWPFITSDTPSILHNDLSGAGLPQRFLPILTSHCIEVAVSPPEFAESPAQLYELLHKPSPAKTQLAKATQERVRFINRSVVMGAEELVFFSKEPSLETKLVQKYRNTGLVGNFGSLPMSDGKGETVGFSIHAGLRVGGEESSQKELIARIAMLGKQLETRPT